LSDGQFYPAGRANKIPLMRIAVVLLSMDFSDIAARDANGTPDAPPGLRRCTPWTVNYFGCFDLHQGPLIAGLAF
jgi:hypothetical protein